MIDASNASQKVSNQNPAGGAKAKKGSRVEIMVSVPGTIPDVSGMSLEQARSALVAAGYKIGNVQYSQQTGAQDGTVVRTEPEANSDTRPGEAVNITVAGSGP